MKKNWIIAVIGIIVIALGVGGYFAYDNFVVKPKRASQEQTKQKTPADETANWPVYKNEKYGFEIKYPEGWIKEEKEDGFIAFEESGNEIQAINVLIFENFKNLSIDKWLESEKSYYSEKELGNIRQDFENGEGPAIDYKIQDVTVSGIKGLDQKIDSTSGSERNVILDYNQKIYIFSLVSDKTLNLVSSSDTSNIEKIFADVLLSVSIK